MMAVARTSLTAALLGALVLSGCGKGGEQAAAPKGQVIAQVGSEAITTQELENELRLDNIPADKQKNPDILKRVLGDLVTRKYLARQALESKLDREPGVLLDILRSKEMVLANAAVTRSVAGKLSAISKADIDKYIANNPSKFANRQLIAVEQITFPVGANAQSVVEGVRDAKSLDEVDQKLTALNIQHSRSMGALNSADLPENLVNQMKMKRPDDVFFLRVGPNGVFVVVKGEEIKPLSGEAAVSFARQSLRADLLKSEIGMASVAANLEAKYQDEYTNVMKPQGQGAGAAQK